MLPILPLLIAATVPLAATLDKPMPLDKCKITSAPGIPDPKKEMSELSGIALSRVHKNLYWVHNDSGNAPVVYGLNGAGESQAVLKLKKAKTKDLEDITTGLYSGTPSIFLADTGNNNHTRKDFSIYVIPEPSKLDKQNSNYKAYSFRYADGKSYNTEGLAYNADDKRLYLLVKDEPILFALPQELKDGMEAQEVCRLKDFKGHATALDISNDGMRYLVRSTDGNVYDYIGCNKLLSKHDYKELGYKEKQGEALAYLPGDNGFISVSEGLSPKLYTIECGE